MTDININNYEAYLLDLAEGELSSSDEKLLMLFLDKNPDLKVEHELFELEKVAPDNISFKYKSDLKKTRILTKNSADNFDELCIARIEGDLTNKETIEFDEIIKSNELKEKEFELYKLAKFVPDQTHVFKNKKRLKKKEAKIFSIRNNYAYISTAASILILLSVYLFIPKGGENADLITQVEQQTKIEQSTNNKEAIVEEQIANKENIIKIDKAKPKEIELIVDENILEIKKTFHREHKLIAYAEPLEIDYNFKKENQYLIKKVDIVKNNAKYERKNNVLSFKSYLALSFNKRILNKENKAEVEMFDIAKVGLEKVNKITGTKMSLERVYAENGDLDRTSFNSRLLAFSAPAKKD